MTDTANVTIVIDMDKKCAECGEGGALPSQICLRCTSKAMGDKQMKSWQGRAVRQRMKEIKK